MQAATHLIIGAGGGVANSLAQTLLAKGEQVTLFSRRGESMPHTASLKGDVLDAAAVRSAMIGIDIAYLTVGFAYNAATWERDWPKAMANCLDAAEATGTRLVFFDNVYAYGPVKGPMTENTPLNPTSRKGIVRQAIVETMQNRMAARRIKGMVVRSADFYGLGSDKTSIPAITIFSRLAENRSPQILASGSHAHSYTFLPDIGPAISRLVAHPAAWGKVWHLPTANPALTGFEFANMAAEIMGKTETATVLPAWLLKTMGLFTPVMREMVEMLYQNDRPYVFSSAQFEKEFGMLPTSYSEGIRQTAASYGKMKEPRYSISRVEHL